MIDGHGDDLYRYGARVRYNFSSNIRDFGSHEALMRHLASKERLLRSYPEPEPRRLEEALAAPLGIAPEQVMAFNGATEAIYMIARRYAGAVSGIDTPTFSEYEDACRLNGHTITDSDDPRCRLHWTCNPNNPTGTATSPEAMARVLDADPDRITVVDASYAGYSVAPVMGISEMLTRSNVLVLGSFTKRFGIPGVRLGYLAGAPELLEPLRRMRMPWSMGALSIEAGLYLLEHAIDFNIDSTGLHREALRIATAFNNMGIATSATDCNFLLCRLPFGDAAELKEWLVERYGILIRDASNFRGLDSRYFRVAAQTPAENDLLIEALGKWTDLSLIIL